VATFSPFIQHRHFIASESGYFWKQTHTDTHRHTRTHTHTHTHTHTLAHHFCFLSLKESQKVYCEVSVEKGLILCYCFFSSPFGYTQTLAKRGGGSEPTSRILSPHKELFLGREMTKCSKYLHSYSNHSSLLGSAVIHKYQGGGAIFLKKVPCMERLLWRVNID